MLYCLLLLVLLCVPVPSMQGGQASPTVQYSVLSALYAYAYAVRLFNGGHHDLALQAGQVCGG